ncbi:hypothetical protein BC829DRAFT_493151 [Chytridium lagenaria]|nr:hypothetical protein BC829DRAFT_493151 [Chytridium lagenaria]
MALKRASDEQYLQSLKNNYEEWGKPQLNLEKYLQRESYLGSFPFSKKGWSAWVLVLEDDTESLDPLSHCETYEQESTFVDNHGVHHSGIVYGIASVFTPLKHRGKGYASTMLKLLESELKSRKHSLGSILFSDIGPTFYNRLGWKPYSTATIEMKVSNEMNGADDLVKLLDEQAGLETLSPVNIESLKGTLSSSSILIHPTSSQFQWLFARSRFYCKELRNAELKYVGAKSRNGSYVLWAPDFKEGFLEIARFVHNGEQVELDALLL